MAVRTDTVGHAAPAAPPYRRRQRFVLPLLVLLATVVGATAGYLLAALPARVYSAPALVDAGPGTSVAEQLSVSPDVSNRFVQTELLYVEIGQADIDAALRERLGIAGVAPVTARQLGATNVVEIAATGSTPQQAADVANIAMAVYIKGWRTRASADVSRGIRTGQTRLAEVRRLLAALPDDGGTPVQQAQRESLTDELARLTTEQANLSFQLNNITAAQRVVQEATADAAVRTSSPTRTAVLGGAAGLFAGIGAVVLLRRRDPAARRSWDAGLA